MGTQKSKVDAFVGRAKKWQGETEKLRSILLECGLDEDLKWEKPCFMFKGRNVAIIQPFKNHCALMFFKGALLQDTHGLLHSQGGNTQSAMRLEFTSEAQVKKTVVKSYVKQAIAVEKAGLKVDFKAKRELELPEELIQILKRDGGLAKAFNVLSPGRRRAYVLHFTNTIEIDGRRDLAYVWNTYTLSAISVGREELVTAGGKSILILRRAEDGSWRFHRVIWNSNPAPR